MKFELLPNNRGVSDDDLLKELRSVALSLNKNYVTKEEYNRTGRFCSSTFQKRFGSWCKAQELAGLKRIRRYDTTPDDCLTDIKRVAALLGRDSVTVAEYREHGKYCDTLVDSRFGSWRMALERAGLRVSGHFHAKITDEQLFENLEHVWESLGRQPTRADFVKPLSRYSYAPYPRRFGTYRKALEAFVTAFESPEPNRPYHEAASPEQHGCVQSPTLTVTRHKTPRNVGWRMRFLVMRRDNFKCKICGCSPALRSGTILVVDHLIPWVDGGETVVENLQTLCEPCNGGKSDLPLREA
jgi:5-methylcytosine-specific restriction endonuclease McrA